jgi:hypothetical protein
MNPHLGLFLVAAVAGAVGTLLVLRRWEPPGPGAVLAVGGVLLMAVGGGLVGGFVRFGAETLGPRDWWIALPAGAALGAGWRCFAVGSAR